MPAVDAPTIVFDGLCKFCNGWVGFVMRRDQKRRFRFATAQSTSGRRLLEKHGLSSKDLSTVLFVQGEQALVKSDAAIRILVALGGAWRLAGGLRLVPRFLRDRVYEFTARNRFRIAGRYDTCPLPPPDRVDQFLP
jgi:predicted DCC family thiol-disulfide oxidoreductase YuxK